MAGMIRHFLTDQRGAVAVDWVVLGAGLVGLGMAATAVVFDGLEALSTDVGGTLARQSISFARLLQTEDFAAGAGNWLGATATYVAGFGTVLGPVAGTANGRESVAQVFSLPPGATGAVLSFDLLSFDSLDGGNTQWGNAEGPVLYINGVEVARAASQNGRLTWTHADIPGVSVASTEVRAQENIGGVSPGRADWQDGINRVTITVADPGDSLRFGFGLVANQSVQDESAGIDNFALRATGPGL